MLAFVILVPIHVRELGSTEGVPPESPSKNGTQPDDGDFGLFDLGDGLEWHFMLGASLYLVFHLIFLYVFSLLALLFLRHTYLRFIAARQLFALELAGSVAARTVLMERLPPHLKNDKALASYWQDSCHLPVESVSVVRDVGELGTLLRKRTDALFALENAWRKWLGNPVKTSDLPDYDPDAETRRIIYGAGDIAPGDRHDQAQGMRREDRKTNGSVERPAADSVEEAEEGAAEAAASGVADQDEETADLIPATPLLAHPSKPRPTMLVSWWNPFSKRVDALEHLGSQFREKDDAVRRRRRGRFRTTDQAFVTFESLAAAQVAAQVVHNPTPGLGMVTLAPEPRDIHVRSSSRVRLWPIR